MRPATKPGKYGPLYRYQIDYTPDPTPNATTPRYSWRCWAYSREHALDKFNADGLEFAPLAIACVPETGGMTRARFELLS